MKMSKQVRKKLSKIYTKQCEDYSGLMIFALGRDSKKVIRKIIKVPMGEEEKSCSQMLGLNTKDLTQIYLGFQKDNLIFCGLARVSPGISRGWSMDAGHAIIAFQKLYFLTVASQNPKSWKMQRCWFSKYIITSRLRFV